MIYRELIKEELERCYNVHIHQDAWSIKHDILNELYEIESKLSAWYRVSSAGITPETIKPLTSIIEIIRSSSNLWSDGHRELVKVTGMILVDFANGEEVDHRTYRGNELYNQEYWTEHYKKHPRIYEHLMKYSAESIEMFLFEETDVMKKVSKLRKLMNKYEEQDKGED